MSSQQTEPNQILTKLNLELERQKPKDILNFMIGFIETEKKNQKTQQNFSKRTKNTLQTKEYSDKISSQRIQTSHSKDSRLLYADSFQVKNKIDQLKKTFNQFNNPLFQEIDKQNKKKRPISIETNKKQDIVFNVIDQVISQIQKVFLFIKQQEETDKQIFTINYEIQNIQNQILELENQNIELTTQESQIYDKSKFAKSTTFQKKEQQYSVLGNIQYFKKDNHIVNQLKQYQQQIKQKQKDLQIVKQLIDSEKNALFEINKQITQNRIQMFQNENIIQEQQKQMSETSKLIPSYIQQNNTLQSAKQNLINQCQDVINDLQKYKDS